MSTRAMMAVAIIIIGFLLIFGRGSLPNHSASHACGGPDYVPGLLCRVKTGTATLTAGLTSVDVAHGLGQAPDRVFLTPTTDTAGKRYWVSVKGAVAFTVTVDSAAGADISWDWRAQEEQ